MTLNKVVILIFIAITIFIIYRSNNLKEEINTYEEYEIATIKDGKQYVEITLNAKGYTPIIVQEDIPVVFNIKVINVENFGCTNTVKIPQFDIRVNLQNGDNYITFLPTEKGEIKYMCWMNMVYSKILVVGNLEEVRK